MGFLSDIWKGIKGIVSGVLSIFKPILKPIQKFLGSSIGKVLMIVASIFTFGAALMAGGTAFFSAAGAANSFGSFMGAFVEGGKAFMTSLTGIGGAEAATTTATMPAGGPLTMTAEEAFMAAGQGAGAGTGFMETAAAAAGPPVGSTGNILGGSEAISAATAAAPAAGPTTALAKAGGELATRVPPGAEGNWLSKAAKGAWEYVKSEPGSELVGDIIGGIGGAMGREDEQAHERRVEEQFANPDDPGMQDMARQRAEGYNLPTADTYGQRLPENQRAFKPTIPYRGRLSAAAGG